MAQTTSAINACGAVLEVDDILGVPNNISGSSNRANLKLSKAMGQGVTFEGEWNFRLECKKDGSLELLVMYTTDTDEGWELLADWWEAGGNRTVKVYPAGKINGAKMFSAEYKLQDLDLPIDGTDPNPIMVTATLLPDGAINFSNFVS